MRVLGKNSRPWWDLGPPTPLRPSQSQTPGQLRAVWGTRRAQPRLAATLPVSASELCSSSARAVAPKAPPDVQEAGGWAGGVLLGRAPDPGSPGGARAPLLGPLAPSAGPALLSPELGAGCRKM